MKGFAARIEGQWKALMRRESVAAPGALFLLTILTRLPFATRYLYHWDSVQFALALDRFDVLHHQPHPPGYLFYVMLGRAARVAFPEHNAALVSLSVAGSAGATVMVYLLAKKLFGPRAALLSGLFFASSPLFWFYGEVALTYALEAFLSAALVYLLLRVRPGDPVSMVWCALVLALAGGMRQSTAALLLPLFVYVLWQRAGARGTVLALVVFGASSLAWIVPTVTNAGGLGAYLEALGNLRIVSSAQTSVFTGGLPALLVSLAQFVRSVWYALELALFPLVLLLLGRFRVRGLPAEASGWFVSLWVGLAIVTFTLLHQGQLGYALFLLVPAAVYLPAVLTAFGEDVRRRLAHDGLLKDGRTGTAHALPVAFGVLVAWNALSFLLVPAPVSAQALRQSDATWDALVGLRSQFTPQGAVFLTEAGSGGSFRHAGFYLPEYEVYAVQVTGEQMGGWYFRAHNRLPSYSLIRKELVPKPEIALRPTTTDVVLLDEPFGRFADGQIDRTIPLAGGRMAYALRVYGGEALQVTGQMISVKR